MMISLSLLTAVLGEDIDGVGGRDGGHPDLTFSAQVGLLAEDCVAVSLTAFLIRVISSARDDSLRLWIWSSLSRISWNDGCSVVFHA